MRWRKAWRTSHSDENGVFRDGKLIGWFGGIVSVSFVETECSRIGAVSIIITATAPTRFKHAFSSLPSSNCTPGYVWCKCVIMAGGSGGSVHLFCSGQTVGRSNTAKSNRQTRHAIARNIDPNMVWRA